MPCYAVYEVDREPYTVLYIRYPVSTHILYHPISSYILYLCYDSGSTWTTSLYIIRYHTSSYILYLCYDSRSTLTTSLSSRTLNIRPSPYMPLRTYRPSRIYIRLFTVYAPPYLSSLTFYNIRPSTYTLLCHTSFAPPSNKGNLFSTLLYTSRTT